MPPIIVGSTLDSLGQNALLAAQQEQDARQATANLLLRQMMANQQDRQYDKGINQQRYETDARSREATDRNNLMRYQWDTPNATSTDQIRNNREIAELPWTRGMTPGQQAEIDLRRQQIEAATKNPFFSMGGGKNPIIDDYIRHTERDNNANRDATASAAAANALLGARVNQLAQPRLKSRLNSGEDNPHFRFGFGGLTGGNADAAANGILGLDVPPSWAPSDAAVQGTQAWWNNPTNALKNQIYGVAQNQLLQEHPEYAPYVQWDATGNRFIPKQQQTQFMGGFNAGDQPKQNLPFIPNPNAPKTNIPMADGIVAHPLPTNTIPSQAVEMLRANPSLRPYFEQKYGPGSSASVLY